jgi:hypothetical protein
MMAKQTCLKMLLRCVTGSNVSQREYSLPPPKRSLLVNMRPGRRFNSPLWQLSLRVRFGVPIFGRITAHTDSFSREIDDAPAHIVTNNQTVSHGDRILSCMAEIVIDRTYRGQRKNGLPLIAT